MKHLIDRSSLKYLLLCSISLVGCVSLPPPPAEPALVTPPKAVVITPACNFDEGLAKLATPIATSECSSDKLLALAQQMMSNHADINRVQSQLDQLQAQALSPASRQFAQLLASQLAERKRLNALLDKQNVATKEQQKRANDLAAKLDAFKDMEKEMLARNKKP
jgi:outer membrane PBP1 activator LpoA protein